MIDRGIARDGYRCLNEAGDVIGVIASGSPSPTLGKNIALAFVPPAMAALGTTIYVEIRGQLVEGPRGSDSVLQEGQNNRSAMRNELGSERMEYPKTYRYTKDDEWIEVKGDLGTVGLTHEAQCRLGESSFWTCRQGDGTRSGEAVGRRGIGESRF